MFGLMDKESMVYEYALAAVFADRPAMYHKILDFYGSAGAVFGMGRDELEELFRNNKRYLGKLLEGGLLEQSRKTLEWCHQRGVKLLWCRSDSYPPLLKECEDAPPFLFYMGNGDLSKNNVISIVGTRLASSYGREMCSRIVKDMAELEAVIVSGLAFGIDIAAHKASLDCGIATVGILPCGIDTIYPASHRNIARRMVSQGGIITEFPPGTPVRRWQFLKRNRIIAGMARALIVVESRMKGGAMSSVEMASSYGRDIYAVPGRYCDVNSAGCNYLISKNIAQIYTAGSIEFGGMKRREGAGEEFSGSNLFSVGSDKKEKILLSLKSDSPRGIDALCAEFSIPFDEMAMILLDLELEGRVGCAFGRYRYNDKG